MLLLADARADAIAPGPPVCPPGYALTIEDHAEVCAFSPTTLAWQGGALLILALVAVGIAAALSSKRKG